MIPIKSLGRDRKGVSAVEFALVAPVLVMMIVGLTQMGRLFFANADIHSAVEGGGRFATIYPRPDDDDILDMVESDLTGLNPDLLINEIAYGRDAGGNLFADLRAAYDIRLDFLFFQVEPIRLEARRRVFVHEATGAMPTGSSGGSTSSGGTTTSAGGTTTTSGGTTTTSGGTTTTSGGTTTTSGGTTTTSGGTTTTSGGTTTSTGGTTGNGNHGNGNGGSPPGKCRRCS